MLKTLCRKATPLNVSEIKEFQATSTEERIELLREQGLSALADSLENNKVIANKLAAISEWGYKKITIKQQENYLKGLNFWESIPFVLNAIFFISLPIAGLVAFMYGIQTCKNSWLTSGLLGFMAGIVIAPLRLATLSKTKIKYKTELPRYYGGTLPTHAISNLIEANKRGVFDRLEIVSLEHSQEKVINDPLLVGRISGSETWFLIDQWDKDIDIKKLLNS